MEEGLKLNEALNNEGDYCVNEENVNKAPHMNQEEAGGYLAREQGNEDILGQLGRFNEAMELHMGSFKFHEGIHMLKALDVSSANFTAQMLRQHLMRILLNLILAIYMAAIGLWDRIRDLREVVGQFKSYVRQEASERSKADETAGLIGRSIAFFYYYFYCIERIPTVLFRMARQHIVGHSPVGLRAVQEALPLSQSFSLPSSIALILRVNDMLMPLPPNIPQPYLDSDKKIRLPREQDVQKAYLLRNEYFTQSRTHIAAEKVRMLSEIGKLVTWSSLIPTIEFVVAYERFGYLWEAGKTSIEAKLEIIASSISSELTAFHKTCSKDELEDIKSLLPTITLVDCFSGIRLVLEEELNESPNDESPNDESDLLDSFVSSYDDRRNLTVYLSDNRLRENPIQEYDVNAVLSSYFSSPPTPELVLVPRENPTKAYTTDGFSCSFEREGATSVMYSKGTKFCFNLFSRSLFKFVAQSIKETKLNGPETTSVIVEL